jgi:hypothetical protein
MSVLALALIRRETSQRDITSAVPVGQPWGAGQTGQGGQMGHLGRRLASYDTAYCCMVCGQPARFGFDVHLRLGRVGHWFCAAHRPQAEARA